MNQKFNFVVLGGGKIKFVSLESLIFIFAIGIMIFSNCDPTQENIKTVRNGDLVNRNKPVEPPEKEVFYPDCSDIVPPPWSSPSCREPHCNCPGGYSREDLNPCDYDNMYDYSYAVVCELNRVSHNCSAPGLPNGCTELEGCILSLSTPAAFLSNHPNSNPWLYCESSDDCNEEWNCPILNLSFTVHLYLSVDDQDILVDHAWDLATTNAPSCPGTGFSSIPYAVYFKVCQQGNYPFNCTNESLLCTNLDIRLHVLYKCCSPG